MANGRPVLGVDDTLKGLQAHHLPGRSISVNAGNRLVGEQRSPIWQTNHEDVLGQTFNKILKIVAAGRSGAGHGTRRGRSLTASVR